MLHRLAIFAVILAMAVCCLVEAAEQPPQRTLDGSQPADALQIMTILAAEAPLKLADSEQRRAAILALQAVVARDAAAQEAAKAKAAEPKPVEPAKPKD